MANCGAGDGATNGHDVDYVVQLVDEDVGRGLFAARDFARGETVLAETPLVSCQFAWNAAYGYRACHLCLAPLETAEANARRLADDPGVVLPRGDLCATRPAFHVECESCPAGYCSQDCRREAWDRFHKTLCPGSKDPDPNHPMSKLMDLWRGFHMPPETTSVELVARILASIVQSPDPDAASARFMSFMHSTRSVGAAGDVHTHKLLGQGFAVQLEALRVAAAELFAAHADAVGHLLLPDAFASLFALLGRNGQGLATSPFSAWVRAVEKAPLKPDERAAADKLIDELYDAFDAHAGHFLDNEGSGLFEMQSVINHSCEPNAEVAYPFNSHRCVVNTLRPVEAGEQILISYLDPSDAGRSQHSRRKLLAENYMFDCGCPKCEAQKGDPDETSEEEMDEDEEGDEEEGDDEAADDVT